MGTREVFRPCQLLGDTAAAAVRIAADTLLCRRPSLLLALPCSSLLAPRSPPGGGGKAGSAFLGSGASPAAPGSTTGSAAAVGRAAGCSSRCSSRCSSTSPSSTTGTARLGRPPPPITPRLLMSSTPSTSAHTLLMVERSLLKNSPSVTSSSPSSFSSSSSSSSSSFSAAALAPLPLPRAATGAEGTASCRRTTSPVPRTTHKSWLRSALPTTRPALWLMRAYTFMMGKRSTSADTPAPSMLTRPSVTMGRSFCAPYSNGSSKSRRSSIT